MLIVRWLSLFLKTLGPDSIKPGHEQLIEAMIQTCDGLLMFFHTLYNHGLWMRRKCAEFARVQGLTFLRGFKCLARLCFNMSIPSYSLKPKRHAFHHILFDIKDALDKGAPLVLNPLIYNCEQNEDFVGRMSG